MKKVAVLGLGAIGGLVAGYLKAKGLDVIGVGREEQKRAIEQDGLMISGVRGHSIYALKVRPKLEEKVDLAIIATKTQDIKDLVMRSRDFLQDGLILSTQNGVRADRLLELMLGGDRLVSSIVMFGVTYEPFNKIIHNFEGKWLLGRPFSVNDGKVVEAAKLLEGAFEAEAVEEISPMKWTKVFVNFSNCLPALLGLSMQETYADLKMCGLSLALIREGLDIADRTGVRLVEMPGFSIEKFRGLTKMPPEEAAKIYSGIMTGLSKEPLYGSILQSIKRKRPSEIDYINGEIVNQARQRNLEAKLNARAVALVHRVQESGKFLTPEEAVLQMEDAASFCAEDVKIRQK